MSAKQLGRMAIAVGLLSGLGMLDQARAGEGTDPQNDVREWSDSTGRFHMTGSLVEASPTRVRLQKQDGPVVVVAVSRLSSTDRQFVFEFLDSPVNQEHLKEAQTRLTKKIHQWWTEVALRTAHDVYQLASTGPLFSEAARAVPENMIYVRVSAPFLQRMAQHDIRRNEPVQDQILSAQVVGRSQTVGQTSLELFPCQQAGLAQLHFTGTTSFNTVGYVGPIQIYTTGATRVQSVKSIWIDGQGLHTSPAKTQAQTTSQINDIHTSLPRLLGRLSLRIAWNRATQSHPLSDEITAEHTGRHVNSDLDEATTAEFNQFWNKAQTQLAALPAEHPLRPSGIKASSTADGLQLVVLGPRGQNHRLLPEPSPMLDQADVEIQIHVSAIRQALTDTALRKLLRPVMTQFVSIPQQRAGEIPKIQWSDDGKWLTLSWKADADSTESSFVNLSQGE